MNWLTVLTLVLQVALLFLFWFSKKYVTEKAKNQATKEDI